MSYRKLNYLLTALGACAFSTVAVSAEMKDSGTISYAMTEISRSPLSGGKALLEFRMSGVLVASDPADPVHLSSQDCLGAGVVEGAAFPQEDHGVCAIFDKDGDAWWLTYSNRGDERKWTALAGLGKYAGITGAGTTKLLSVTQDGRMTLSWAGTLRMK